MNISQTITMAQVPPAFMAAAGGYRHVCMMEGPDPELRLSTLQYDTLLAESKRNADEVKRLKFLLRKHHIECDTSLAVTIKYVCKNDPLVKSDDDLKPRLPAEILLRILGFALTSPVPVVDPFYRLRDKNITMIERFSRRFINIRCLAVSQVFKTEGMRILLENNEFVFTQAAALENFAKVPPRLRSTIKHVTLRVVGRYYDDAARKVDLTGNGCYHDTVPRFLAPVLARPYGMINDKGIQAYCWFQLADFLRAMQLPREMMSANRPKLFPGLLTMRLDLVNFCDHLPLGMSVFAAIVRWHLGRILDELVVTGLPDMEASADEQMVLRNLLRDEGLFSAGCPAFVSVKDGLKSLPVYGYNHHVVTLRKAGKKVSKKKFPIPHHPEGGKPPKSTHPTGHTIWKWAKEQDDEPKQWIEFDRASGRPMSEIDEDEDEEEDDDSDQFGIDALLGLPFLPMFGPPPPLHVNQGGDEQDDDEDSEGMPELIDPEQGDV
ncbi:hypothetical protein BKA65DRAFT_542521 [Rhexocercosporidium sp. MPI-PUGE-AT-0058]|nr:hypothetical protein BKA65DRAFT_542521 [Rhexocercosporidium sp. MPI-PUGE-AT-0058]